MVAMSDLAFLRKLKLIVDEAVTNAAMVLLSTEDSSHKVDPRPEIVWILRNPEGDTLGGETFFGSLVLGIEAVLSNIRNIDYKFLRERNTLNTVQMKMYDTTVLRELLHNSVAHQDYGMKGRITVLENERFLNIHNLGSFIPVSIENVIDIDFPPPYYRNRLLATAMKEVGMIERYGSGIRRTMRTQAARCFPLPDFKIDDTSVKVKVYGTVINDHYTWILSENPKMSLKEIYLLDKVQKGMEITEGQTVMLRRKGFISGKKPLTVALNAKDSYPNGTRLDDSTAVNAEDFKESELKVYNVICEGVAITRGEIAAASGVPERSVRRAIESLTEKKLITRVGSNKSGKWVESKSV